MHEKYSMQMARLYDFLRRRLTFQLELAAACADRLIGSLTVNSLEAHAHRPALVLDATMWIHNANPMAVEELRRADFIQDRGGRLRFVREAHQKMALRMLASGPPAGQSLYMPSEGGMRVVRASTLEINPPGMAFADCRYRRVLLTLSNAQAALAKGFAAAFELTAAEASLCRSLAAGLTLVEAATSLGVLESTARQRLKVVLGKTRTSRQSDLMRLMLA